MIDDITRLVWSTPGFRPASITIEVGHDTEDPDRNQKLAWAILWLSPPLRRQVCRDAGSRPGVRISITRDASPPRRDRDGSGRRVVRVGADYVRARIGLPVG